MQHLFLDCSHGMSGDMTLASLAHLGVDLSPLPGLLAQAGVACRLEVWQEERGGGPGCRVEVSPCGTRRTSPPFLPPCLWPTGCATRPWPCWRP